MNRRDLLKRLGAVGLVAAVDPAEPIRRWWSLDRTMMLPPDWRETLNTYREWRREYTETMRDAKLTLERAVIARDPDAIEAVVGWHRDLGLSWYQPEVGGPWYRVRVAQLGPPQPLGCSYSLSSTFVE